MCPPQATAQPGHWHVLMKDAGRCPKLKRTCSMASLSFCASSASPCATATARGMGPNGCRSATALSLVGCRSRLVESDKKPTAWPEPISASASAQQGEGSRQQGRFLYVCQAACLGGASPVSVIHIFLLCNQRQCSALLQRNLSPLRRPASPSALATGTSSIPSFCPSWGSYKLARAATRLPFRSSQVLTPSGAAPSGVNRAAAAPKWAAAGLDWCRKGSGGSDDGSMWFPGRLQLQQQHCCRLWTADSDHAMGHRAVAAVCAGRLSSSYSGQNSSTLTSCVVRRQDKVNHFLCIGGRPEEGHQAEVWCDQQSCVDGASHAMVPAGCPCRKTITALGPGSPPGQWLPQSRTAQSQLCRWPGHRPGPAGQAARPTAKGQGW